jgi:hypothetical protein
VARSTSTAPSGPVSAVPATVLHMPDRRALNRASLHRQLLLERAALPALDAVRRLVALQAQAANAPYVGLWSRLRDFDRAGLTDLLHDRSVVRGSLLRGTQHLAAAEDYRWLRPLVQPALDRARQAAFGRRTAGIDLSELAAEGRRLLDGRTLTRPQLRELLARRWPDRDPEALGWSVQALLPLVHPPPNGTWGRGGATPFALADQWLGGPLAAEPSVEDLVLRYLAAFGPAGVMDAQAWSGLTRLREVLDRMRPRLRTLSGEDGRELFDLPDADQPDPGTPAPPRFLPEFDNLIVAYADRTRLMGDEVRRRVCVGSMVYPTVLVDGVVAGVWRIERADGGANLVVEEFAPVSGGARAALAEEGARLLGWAAGGQAHDVRFLPAA